MNLTQLKAYFRTKFKVVNGGPATGPAGITRASGVLATLDALGDFATESFVALAGTEPSTPVTGFVEFVKQAAGLRFGETGYLIDLFYENGELKARFPDGSQIGFLQDGTTFAVQLDFNGNILEIDGTGTLLVNGQPVGGAAKLYAAFGTNTDGALTQAFATAQFGSRLTTADVIDQFPVVTQGDEVADPANNVGGGSPGYRPARGAALFFSTGGTKHLYPPTGFFFGDAVQVRLSSAAAALTLVLHPSTGANVTVTVAPGETVNLALSSPTHATSDGNQGSDGGWTVRNRSQGTGGGSTGPWPSFTTPVTDDVNKLFKATIPADYRTTAAEYTVDGGTTTTIATEAMRTGNVLAAPVAGNKAIGQVGWRLRADAGRAAGPWLFNEAAFTASALSITWDANNPNITYSSSGGVPDWVFNTTTKTPRRGAGVMVTNVLAATGTFVVPAGVTKMMLGGHKDSGGSFFTLDRAGTRVAQTDQFSASGSDANYLPAEVDVVPGQTIVFTRTDAAYGTAPGGPNPNLENFFDQVHFSS